MPGQFFLLSGIVYSELPEHQWHRTLLYLPDLWRGQRRYGLPVRLYRPVDGVQGAGVVCLYGEPLQLGAGVQQQLCDEVRGGEL